jgi:hypothetical protein
VALVPPSMTEWARKAGRRNASLVPEVQLQGLIALVIADKIGALRLAIYSRLLPRRIRVDKKKTFKVFEFYSEVFNYAFTINNIPPPINFAVNNLQTLEHNLGVDWWKRENKHKPCGNPICSHSDIIELVAPVAFSYNLATHTLKVTAAYSVIPSHNTLLNIEATPPTECSPVITLTQDNQMDVDIKQTTPISTISILPPLINNTIDTIMKHELY